MRETEIHLTPILVSCRPNSMLIKAPEAEERRTSHLQETLIDRPYGTGRVFSLFYRHFVPGRLRSDSTELAEVLRRARQPGVCPPTLCGRDVGLRRAQSSRFAESGYHRFTLPHACTRPN